MKLLCPVEINYNTIRHYICHLLAHPLLYLLWIHYFIKATQPVSCQELLSLVSRQSDSGYSDLPNAPTSTGPTNALIAFLAWSGQRSRHCLLWPQGSSVHPTTPLSLLGIHTFVIYVCVSISALKISLPILFSRLHIYVLIYNICFSLSDLLHPI